VVRSGTAEDFDLPMCIHIVKASLSQVFISRCISVLLATSPEAVLAFAPQRHADTGGLIHEDKSDHRRSQSKIGGQWRKTTHNVLLGYSLVKPRSFLVERLG